MPGIGTVRVVFIMPQTLYSVLLRKRKIAISYLTSPGSPSLVGYVFFHLVPNEQNLCVIGVTGVRTTCDLQGNGVLFIVDAHHHLTAEHARVTGAQGAECHAGVETVVLVTGQGDTPLERFLHLNHGKTVQL